VIMARVEPEWLTLPRVLCLKAFECSAASSPSHLSTHSRSITKSSSNLVPQLVRVLHGGLLLSF
jgi:hypothetical protein